MEWRGCWLRRGGVVSGGGRGHCLARGRWLAEGPGGWRAEGVGGGKGGRRRCGCSEPWCWFWPGGKATFVPVAHSDSCSASTEIALTTLALRKHRFFSTLSLLLLRAPSSLLLLLGGCTPALRAFLSPAYCLQQHFIRGKGRPARRSARLASVCFFVAPFSAPLTSIARAHMRRSRAPCAACFHPLLQP